MAATTYTGLVARLRLTQATDDTDADFNAIIPALIGDAELRCYRDLDPVYARRADVPVTLSAGVATATLPADCWILRELYLASGTSRMALLVRQPDFLAEYWPDRAQTGTPKYAATPVENTLLLAPTPGAGHSLIVSYTYRPATLSETNPTTWLSENYPDLMFYAAMIWLSGYNKAYGGEDPRGPTYWQGEYNTALVAARLEEALKKGVPPLPAPPTPPVRT